MAERLGTKIQVKQEGADPALCAFHTVYAIYRTQGQRRVETTPQVLDDIFKRARIAANQYPEEEIDELARRASVLLKSLPA